MTESLTKEREILERLAREVAQRGMCAPAIFLLETAKPLSFVASQALLTFEPIIQSILTIRDYEVFVSAMEDRANVEWLIQRLEALEDERLSHTPDKRDCTDEPG